MRKLFFILFIGLSSLNLYGQQGGFQYNNVIKISPVAFTNAEFQIGYEHYFNNRKSSIVIMPSVILKDNSEEQFEGLQLMGQYRFYLTHLRKSEGKSILGLENIGLYTGVYGLYLDYHEEYSRQYFDQNQMDWVNGRFEKDVTSYEGGALIGVQVDITNRIVFDFYVGGGIRRTELEDTWVPTDDQPYYDYYGVFDPEYQGVKPEIGFQLGFTF